MTDQKLEQYLSVLDKALGQIPISDRADIVTELKSHVLSALEKDPEATVSKVLASLGEPEAVANRYLMERGLKPGKPSKSPMVKWLTIGFLGTFGIAILGFLLLVWKFTPILKIDEEKGRVVILGGLIDIDEKRGTLQIGSTAIHHDENEKLFEGSKPIDPKKVEQLQIDFANGKIETSPSFDSIFRWKCKYSSTQNGPTVSENNKVIKLNLSTAQGVRCEVSLPKVPTEISGNNGKIQITNTQAALTANLDNGQIRVVPDPNQNYRYDAKVLNGQIQGLNSSSAKDAIQIQLLVKNGQISSD